MVEITHKGTWVKWSSLDARDKGWFVLSMAAALPFGLILAVPAGEWAYQLGHHLRSDGAPPDMRHFAAIVGSDVFRYAVIAGLICGTVSAAAWWRFSIRQDEMFNRIQNYALGQTGAWSLAGATAWWVLSLGGWTGPFLPGPFLAASLVLLCAFWFYAVARWA
jgi:hypothetical protein